MALLLFVAAVVTPLTLSLSATASRATAGGAAASTAEAPRRDAPPRVASRSAGRVAGVRVASPRPTMAAPADVAAQAERDLHRAPEAGVVPVATPDTLGWVGDVELLVPAPRDAEAVIGFHQAGAGSRAHVMTPAGSTLDSAVPGFELITGATGHDHHVLASRGRGTAATTAVDVALHPGTPVIAPVSGVIEKAEPYSLYGRVEDVAIVIVSDVNPDVAIHVLHVQDPLIRKGQRVEAGVTPLATVRVLPFSSQIDRITADGRPHAHLEVRPR